MIPGISRFSQLILLLMVGSAGCSYSWMARPAPEGVSPAGPTKISQGPPVEEPPQPSQPLAIPGPAPAKAVTASAKHSDNPSVAPPLTAAKEPTVATPIPNAAPVAEAKPTSSSNPLRSLHARAAQRYAGTDSYTALLTRRERLKGRMQPEEQMVFKFRQQPWSVYFKWVGNEHKGREVIFVKGQHDGKIHTLTAAGDGFLGAGKHWAVSPDNMLVKANSRHAITESGVGVLIERFGELLDRIERRDPAAGTMTYLGGVRRPEFETAVEGVRQHIPPGVEKGLEQGGQRLWFFDPVYSFPLLTITTDLAGQELEYYCYHRFQVSAPFSDADFNPKALWGR